MSQSEHALNTCQKDLVTKVGACKLLYRHSAQVHLCSKRLQIPSGSIQAACCCRHPFPSLSYPLCTSCVLSLGQMAHPLLLLHPPPGLMAYWMSSARAGCHQRETCACGRRSCASRTLAQVSHKLDHKGCEHQEHTRLCVSKTPAQASTQDHTHGHALQKPQHRQAHTLHIHLKHVLLRMPLQHMPCCCKGICATYVLHKLLHMPC